MTDATQPTDRYPQSRRSVPARGVALLLGALVIALGFAVAYLGYTKFTTSDVDGQAVSFELIDATTVNIRLNVTRDDPSKAAVCIVRSRSRDGTETGRREVYIPPSTSGTVDVRTSVTTSQPPALADLYGCSLNVPSYLKPPP